MRGRRISPAAGWPVALLLALVLAGCGSWPGTGVAEPPRASALPTASAETATSPGTPPAVAATDTPPAAAPPPATPPATAPGALGDTLAPAREALAAYQPVADAWPAVDAVLQAVASWLEAGGQPESLPDALGAVPGGAEPTMAQAWEVDLTGDGQPDTVLRIPVMGLPLFLFTSQRGAQRPTPHFLPPDLDSIQLDFPVEQTEWAAARPAVEIRDVTGDGPPEVLFTTMGSGASSVQLFPHLYQWHEEGFRLIFAATLVDWAGRSSLALEPDPSAAGRSQIALTYPQLYGQGFDHKLVNHPAGRQVWRWSPGAGRYTAAEQSVDLEAGTWTSTLEDRLRWLTNEAEIPFRSGDYEEAVAGYDVVLRASAASAEEWRPGEGEPNWPALAAFRRAEALLLAGTGPGGAQAGQAREGREAMVAVAEAYGEDMLGLLANAFLEGYGQGNGPEAAARGVAALQDVPLYDHFYYEEPGALRFPMDAAGILYPGAGLAAYLQAHPELAADPARLQAGLVEIGFDVVDVIKADDGALQVLLAPQMPSDLPLEGEVPAVPWLLVPPHDSWRVAPPSTGTGNGWPAVGTF